MPSHRKLAAILSADVAGYSRLMGNDERATVETLNAYRQVIRERVERHHGRVVDSPGDALLAEFPSAMEAVECADETQRELAKRNAQLAEHRRMIFRFGINVGDVIEENGILYGDGVNIAARLESLCTPGGLCISGTVFDQIEGKLSLAFEFLGEQPVKNITKPVRAYRVAEKPEPVAQHPAFGHRKALLAIAVLVAIGGASAVFWRLQSSPAPSLPGQVLRKQAVLDHPDRPSIAVLPFANLSGDPKQEYFADGITEDIITALSKMERLLVIARNSAFQYKGKAVDVRQVSRDLGVHHVLEGSVRRQGSLVRVTAQLIDATTGAHLWSESYDRPAKDIFAVQDEITHRIVDALNVQVIEGEQARVWRKTTRNMEAYDYFLRGREQILRYTPETLALAQANLETAIRLDPNFALAYTQLGYVPLMSSILGVSDDPERDQRRALALGRKAVELDDSQGYSVVLLGRVYMQVGQLDKALEYGKRAVALEPNGATTLAIYAHMLEAAGRCEEALMYFNKSLRLAPLPEAWIPWVQGLCLRKLGHYEEAIAAQQHAIALAPSFIWWHVFLVDAYVAAGKEEPARTKAREILQIDPSFSVDAFLKLFHWYRDPGILKSYAANLRRAGLP